MEDQLEIGGAHALLQLGENKNSSGDPTHSEITDKEFEQSSNEDQDTRSAENKTSSIPVAPKVAPTGIFSENMSSQLGRTDLEPHATNDAHSTNNNTEVGPNENSEVSDLMDKANQLLNDAVEAAVMRYVGGTLDGGEELSGTGNNHSDGETQEDDDLSRKRSRLNPEDILSEYQWDKFLEDEVAAGFERPSPKKKLRRTYDSGQEIDPDLDDLDGHSEHDQLVHAAILGAGELAKQLTLPGFSHNRLAQATLNHDRRLGHLDESDSAAIDQLAQAATSLSNGGSRKKRLSGEPKRSLKSQQVSSNANDTSVQESKYICLSLESLIEQASSEACSWYNSQTDVGDHKPRLFSQVEINIMEHFLRGYCQINHLSRMDICRRVWTSERPKDNFWESVTKVLPYRSKASVYKHIRRQYHVFQVRAKWTPAEDELLQKLTETSATNWKEIGEAMNRMPEDCRDRWRNYIKCGANRVMNKWSDEEEQSLKNIVMEMITNESQNDKPILINWTIVSERMNGVRSRIQCRYKWNKLLRRESLSRISMMDTSIKLWVLNRMLESNVTEIDAIDWDYIVHMYHEMHKEKNKILWTTADFRVAFEKMRASMKDHKNLPLQTVITKLIDSLYQSTVHEGVLASSSTHNSSNIMSSYEELRPKPFHQSGNAEHEAALVANAAVAAVSSSVSERDAQQQEYSLWR